MLFCGINIFPNFYIIFSKPILKYYYYKKFIFLKFLQNMSSFL